MSGNHESTDNTNKDRIIHILNSLSMNLIKLSAISVVAAMSFLAHPAFALDKGSNKKQKVPNFSYPNMDKTKNYSPDDFNGKYLLIDFWASWCPPCNAAAPELKRLYSEYSDKGFEILGVSIDSNEQAWRKKLVDKGFKWTNIITPDSGKEVASLYGFNSIPFFVLVDNEGNVIDKGFSIGELPLILKNIIK